MENVAYIQQIDYVQTIKSPELINYMIDIGFDFGLTGTKYIYELYLKSNKSEKYLYDSLFPSMSGLADRHNIKLKSLNRDVRWSIERFSDYDKPQIILHNYEHDELFETKNEFFLLNVFHVV